MPKLPIRSFPGVSCSRQQVAVELFPSTFDPVSYDSGTSNGTDQSMGNSSDGVDGILDRTRGVCDIFRLCQTIPASTMVCFSASGNFGISNLLVFPHRGLDYDTFTCGTAPTTSFCATTTCWNSIRGKALSRRGSNHDYQNQQHLRKGKP